MGQFRVAGKATRHFSSCRQRGEECETGSTRVSAMIDLKALEPAEKIIDVGGKRLQMRVRISGSGPPLLYLHPAGCAGKFFWPIADYGLGKRLHRVTASTLIVWGRQDAL